MIQSSAHQSKSFIGHLEKPSLYFHTVKEHLWNIPYHLLSPAYQSATPTFYVLEASIKTRQTNNKEHATSSFLFPLISFPPPTSMLQ